MHEAGCVWGTGGIVTARIIYFGTPEADADSFERRARVDFPNTEFFCTNDRAAGLARAAGAHALIGHHFQFDDVLLKSATQLRWIQSLTTGTDEILKLPTLRPEIIVTSTRGMHGPQMSELIFLQMLALLRNFPEIQKNQRQQRWVRWPQPLLFQKTVVIVGVGSISEDLAPRCKIFGMRVVGVSASNRIPAGFDAIYSRLDLVKAAELADFLVLIVPYTAATEKLVDAAIINAMKQSAFLINVARGGVLDEQALIQALGENRIAGAALDVFRQMPLPPESPLWRQEKLVITPLLGGMSDIYLEQAYPIVRDNLMQFLAGRTEDMKNVVVH